MVALALLHLAGNHPVIPLEFLVIQAKRCRVFGGHSFIGTKMIVIVRLGFEKDKTPRNGMEGDSMYKRTLASILALSAVCFTYAYDYTGNNWSFNYQGHYSVANVNTANTGIISGVLGLTLNLGAQLNLLNGSVSATNYGTNINQSSLTSMLVNDIQTSTTPPPGLVPALGNFVFDLLDFSDGLYAGSMSGTGVTLTRGSLLSADLFGLVDTRALGTGLVLDIQAAIPTAQLNGTLTGINGGVSGPFGEEAFFVDGQSGLMQTIGLSARVRSYALGNVVTDSGYLNIGVIENFADDWNLTRSATPVPEPATCTMLAMGAMAFLRRRRASQKA